MIKSFEVLILQHFCFILGGVETLYYRMMKWAHAQGMKVLLIIDKNSQIDPSWNEKLKEIGVELYFVYGVYPFYDIKDREGGFLDLSGYRSVLYISEFYGGYIRGEFLRLKYGLSDFMNLFYVLTPHEMMKSKIPFVRFFENIILSHIVKSNSVIFMDEQTCQTAINSHKELLNYKQTIVRLGYEIEPEVSKQALIEKYKSIKKEICSIVRFDFPFKIYILCLIDVFVELSSKYPTLNLLIIGKGSDRNTVLRKISELDKSVAERIILIDGAPYETIKPYIDRAYVNVGMGTTILAFPNRSVPSIVSLANEKRDVCYGFWSENWNVLGGFSQDDMAPLKSISQCIESVLESNEKEYVNLCKKHRMLLIEHYSMKHIMEQILTHDISNKKSINPFVLHMYSILVHFRSVILRLFPQFSKRLARDKRS